mgnify:FL=1
MDAVEKKRQVIVQEREAVKRMYQEREQQKLIQMSMNSNTKRRNPK